VKFTTKALSAVFFLGVGGPPALAATSQLVCRGDTYSVASGKNTAIKRFSRKELTLTAEAGRTAIAYGDKNPIEVDITESHYRATRSLQSGDWVLILLDRETLDISVSEFNTLPGQKHRSERFVGSCEVDDPVALNL
jgi:hypothetical protein